MGVLQFLPPLPLPAIQLDGNYETGKETSMKLTPIYKRSTSRLVTVVVGVRWSCGRASLSPKGGRPPPLAHVFGVIKCETQVRVKTNQIFNLPPQTCPISAQNQHIPLGPTDIMSFGRSLQSPYEHSNVNSKLHDRRTRNLSLRPSLQGCWWNVNNDAWHGNDWLSEHWSTSRPER